MDDLLIVRSSERGRLRDARHRSQAPLAANLGIALGAAFGILFASKSPEAPHLGLALGIAFGLALGGALGPLLKRPAHRAPRFPATHYQGLPAEPKDRESADPDTPQP